MHIYSHMQSISDEASFITRTSKKLTALLTILHDKFSARTESRYCLRSFRNYGTVKQRTGLFSKIKSINFEIDLKVFRKEYKDCWVVLNFRKLIINISLHFYKTGSGLVVDLGVSAAGRPTRGKAENTVYL